MNVDLNIPVYKRTISHSTESIWGTDKGRKVDLSVSYWLFSHNNIVMLCFEIMYITWSALKVLANKKEKENLHRTKKGKIILKQTDVLRNLLCLLYMYILHLWYKFIYKKNVLWFYFTGWCHWDISTVI